MAITPDPSSTLPGSRKGAHAPAKGVKDPAPTRAAAVKKPRAPRKTPTVRSTLPTGGILATGSTLATECTPVVAASLEPLPEDVGSMIATAAYYLSAARNFTPGHELDDWLTAERAVHARLYG